MNRHAKAFLRNVSGAVGANVVRLIISVVLTFVLPKFTGLVEYSYWQLYLFYATYFAYSSLGWCEGVTLKYGGDHYERLDKSLLVSQIWFLFAFQLIFFGMVACATRLFNVTEPKDALLMLACISSVFDIIRYMVQSILHTVNRIGDYVKIVLSERLLFAALALLALALGYRSAKAIVFSEILARLLSMLYSFFVTRDMILTRPAPLKLAVAEAKSEISIGWKLLGATLASQMVIGIVRFGIEQKWGVVQFGKISLIISLANMLVTCVSAIGVVIFPLLRRMDENRMRSLYLPVRRVLTAGVMGCLLFFAPGKWLLSLWFAQYADALKYLAFLLPLGLFEARTSMLVNTYLKVFREEKNILQANVVSILLSLLFTGCIVFLLGSVDLAVLSITVLALIKAYLTERFICPHISWDLRSDLIEEIMLTGAFVAGGWFLSYAGAFILYAAAYGIYLWVNREGLRSGLAVFKREMKGEGA